jgi:hypothetical protein
LAIVWSAFPVFGIVMGSHVFWWIICLPPLPPPHPAHLLPIQTSRRFAFMAVVCPLVVINWWAVGHGWTNAECAEAMDKHAQANYSNGVTQAISVHVTRVVGQEVGVI